MARKPGHRFVAADVTVIRRPGEQTDPERLPLRGPIPWPWLLPALRLPGPAFRVGIACWLQAGWERSGRVELALGEWSELGLSRFSAGRGLELLEEGGLVSVVRRTGRPSVVGLLEPGHGSQDEACLDVHP
jgi:hypothetical protein